MPTTVTETAEYDNGSLPSRPQDGETIYMDGGSAPQWPLWGRLYNRTKHHESLLLGQFIGSHDFAVSGSAPNNFTVTIGAIDSINLYNSTASQCLTYAGGSITQTKVEGGGGTLGASAQWWYVYAFLNAGALDFEISTTAPDATRQVKTGAGTRRYVGCFRTDSSGVPLPVQATRGRYTYTDHANSLHTGQGTASVSTFTSGLSLASRVPPHVRKATVWVRAYRTGSTGTHAWSLRAPSGTNAMMSAVIPALPLLFFDDRHVEMDVGASRQVSVATNHATESLVDVDVVGFVE